MTRFVIAGTDTGIGKTVFAAALSQVLPAQYWKPVQSGLEEETDSQIVARLAPHAVVLAEAYRLRAPLSPHRSAALDGVEIDPGGLHVPDAERLVIEAAGGLMVPLTRDVLYLDVIAGWNLPVVLCARTALGTINHTLLSVAALRARGVALRGIAFIGDAQPDTQEIIAHLSGARVLGRLPMLPDLNAETLQAAFRAGFDQDAFA